MTWITREIASLQKHKQPQKGLRHPQRGPEKSVSWAHNEDFLKRLVLSGISFLFKSAPIYFDYFILKSLLQGSPSCYFPRRNKSCRLEGQTASAVITSLCWCTAKTASEKTWKNWLGCVPIKLYLQKHREVSIVSHTCSPNTQEAEAGRLPQYWGQVELYGKFRFSLGSSMRTVIKSINQSIHLSVN